MSDNTILALLQRIQKETGIVLSRETDRTRIKRYLDNGGELPSLSEPIPAPLINLVTTNETYFERESHHFDRLIDEILPQLERSSCDSIRILTAPCSSGEESYTIALRLALLAKKFPKPIEIIGIDISPEMIEKARRGIYSQRSTHALSQEVLERFFAHENGNYHILPLEGVSIHFITGNIFDDVLWKELGDFDIIFSRNMMIYFDSEKNRELLLRFKKHLRGYLILGHADDHLNAKELFTPIRGERGVIYTT
jgi:chemotaxis protein methyltransferase CheR